MIICGLPKQKSSARNRHYDVGCSWAGPSGCYTKYNIPCSQLAPASCLCDTTAHQLSSAAYEKPQNLPWKSSLTRWTKLIWLAAVPKGNSHLPPFHFPVLIHVHLFPHCSQILFFFPPSNWATSILMYGQDWVTRDLFTYCSVAALGSQVWVQH